MIVAEIGLPVSTYTHIHTTKLFNHIVHWHLWTKVHKILYTCKTQECLFTLKV